jgi:hypothetical protein
MPPYAPDLSMGRLLEMEMQSLQTAHVRTVRVGYVRLMRISYSRDSDVVIFDVREISSQNVPRYGVIGMFSAVTQTCCLPDAAPLLGLKLAQTYDLIHARQQSKIFLHNKCRIID